MSDPLSPLTWLADHREISVEFLHIPNGDMGRWCPDIQTILLNSTLSPGEVFDTLAHETAHIVWDDPPGECDENEWAADDLAQEMFGPYLEPLLEAV